MINAHNKLYRNYLNLDYQIIDNYTSQTDNKLNNIINFGGGGGGRLMC